MINTVLVDPSGNVWACGWPVGGVNIWKLDPNGNLLATYSTFGDYILTATMGSDGSLYTAESPFPVMFFVYSVHKLSNAGLLLWTGVLPSTDLTLKGQASQMLLPAGLYTYFEGPYGDVLDPATGGGMGASQGRGYVVPNGAVAMPNGDGLLSASYVTIPPIPTGLYRFTPHVGHTNYARKGLSCVTEAGGNIYVGQIGPPYTDPGYAGVLALADDFSELWSTPTNTLSPYGIAADGAGIFVTGNLSGGFGAAAVIKLDASGTLLWQSVSAVGGRNVRPGPGGGCYACGLRQQQ